MSEATLLRIRPIKIIAEVFATIAVIWLIISIAGREWVDVKFHNHGDSTWNWGIWHTCNTLDSGQQVCMEADWVTVCLVFSIVSLILCLAATVCGILGLMVADTQRKKQLFYVIAGVLMTVVATLQFMVVVIFPVKFQEDILETENVKRWDFDWTYAFAWGGFIFAVGGAIFFYIPLKKEDGQPTTYYATQLS